MLLVVPIKSLFVFEKSSFTSCTFKIVFRIFLRIGHREFMYILNPKFFNQVLCNDRLFGRQFCPRRGPCFLVTCSNMNLQVLCWLGMVVELCLVVNLTLLVFSFWRHSRSLTHSLTRLSLFFLNFD